MPNLNAIPGETYAQYEARQGYAQPVNSGVNPATGKTNAQVLAESTAAAQQAASMIGGNYTQGSFNAQGQVRGGYTPPPAINSTTLSPQADLSKSVTSPAPTTPYNVGGLNADNQVLTPTGTEAQDLVGKLKELYNSEVGKSAYQSQQETQQGVPELQKTQSDLSAQLKALQNDALAIPILTKQHGIDNGIALPIIGNQTTKQLGDNAIKALTVSTLLEASRGNLSYAQSLADKAVAQKYGPIDEQIKAANQNLDLILKSPQYTMEEKNRAQAQKDLQDKKQAQVDADKKALTDILSFANDLMKNGFNNAVVLQQIQNATDSSGHPSLAQAQQIATQNGASLQTPTSANATKLDTSVVEVGGQKLLVNNQTGQTIKNLGAVTNSNNDQTKVVNEFQKSLVDRSALDKAGTREQFIRQLEAQYPQIDPKSIAQYVYGTWPDNYQGTNQNANAVDYYVKQIKSGTMTIDSVPADIRTTVANKL